MSLEENISHCFREYPKMKLRIEILEAENQRLHAEVARLGELLRQAEFGLVSGPTWGQALKDARQAATEAALRWRWKQDERMVAYLTVEESIRCGLAALLGEK